MRRKERMRKIIAISLVLSLLAGVAAGASCETAPDCTEAALQDIGESIPEDTETDAAEEETEAAEETGADTETETPTEAAEMTEAITATEAVTEASTAEAETEPVMQEDPVEDTDGYALQPASLTETVVCSADGNTYGSVQEAVDACEGSRITLMENVEENIHAENRSFTLDLDSHTLSAAGSGTVLSVTGGTVTVENGTLDGKNTARVLEANGCSFTGKDLTVCNGYANGNGSGIWIRKNAQAMLTDIEICNNTAAGMQCKGGGMSVESSHLEASGLRIYENQSDNTFSSGGGLALTAATGWMRDSSIYSNQAKNGAGISVSGVRAASPFELSAVDVYGNYSGLAAHDGLALYASGKAQYTFSGCSFHDHDGGGIGTLINILSDSIVFDGSMIYSNNNFARTLLVSEACTFLNCRINDNTARLAGGISFNNVYGGLVLTGTVITGNTASGTDAEAAGGLYIGRMTANAMNLDPVGAIYGNHTNSANKANDVFLSSGNTMNAMAANMMADGGMDFTYYKWEDARGVLYADAVTLDHAAEAVCLTAVEEKPHFVARIGNQKYESLQAAAGAATSGDVIVLTAGEDDELGSSFTSGPVLVEKDLTIDFNGRTVSVQGGTELFHVSGGASLCLRGDGTVIGTVVSEGSLTLQGKITADGFVHNGSSFTLDGHVGDISVSLGEGKYLTATQSCAAEAVRLSFDSKFTDAFNDETSDTDSRLLVQHAGTFDPSVLILQGVKQLIVKLVNEDGRVLLQKNLLKGVYIGGSGASDSNTGLSTDSPVATLGQAGRVMDVHPELDTIWALGKIEVSGKESLKKTLKRHPSYDGVLIHVSGALELDGAAIDGMQDYMDGTTGSLIEGDPGSEIYINDGTVLCNNSVMEEKGVIPLSGYTAHLGGAVRSEGTVVMDGGMVKDCHAFMGGGIHMDGDGVLSIKAGTITGCTARGYLNGTPDQAAVPSSGGGLSVSNDAKGILSGGTIEECEAGIGGGICLGGSFGLIEHIKGNESFEMDGGTIRNCTSRSNGGGLYVQGSYRATIRKGTISKNRSLSGNFGGGGIYVNSGGGSYENGRLQLYNAVIRNNVSGSYGGGLAGCNTSDTRIYLNKGGVFYQNTGNGQKDDILLSDSNGATAVSAPDSFVSEFMLGGSPYFWKHAGSGEDYGVNFLHAENMVKHMYTDAQDGSGAITKALKDAAVFIEGNTALEKGGGIGSNGDVVLGTKDTDTEEVTVAKEWDDEGYEGFRPDKVVVWLLKDGKKVSCVEIKKEQDGSWPAASFTDQEKGHKYMVCEDTGNMAPLYASQVDPEGPGAYTVTNHIICGRIHISKSVENLPENQPMGTFCFRVTLQDADGSPLEGPFTVRFGDNTEEISFKDGTDVLYLMDGGELYIDALPGGTSFTIEELDTQGYVVFANDEQQASIAGSITAKQTEEIRFRNVYSGDNAVTVTKTAVDADGHEYPLEHTFHVALFEDKDLTVQATEVKEITFNGAAQASATFGGLKNGKTYYVGELDSEGKPINGCTSYLADGTSFTAQFPNGNSVTAMHGAEAQISFRNVFMPKAVKNYLDVAVTKSLEGRKPDPAKDSYTFILEGVGGAPMPEKQSVVLTLPDNHAAVFSDAFGKIPFIKAGTYMYRIREMEGNTGGVDYDRTVYRLTIRVEQFDTVDNQSALVPDLAALELSHDGKEFSFAEGGTAAFTNTYHAAPASFRAKVEKDVTGDVPQDRDPVFTFVMEQQSGTSVMDGPATCSVHGSGEALFDAVKFTQPGSYSFIIREQQGNETGFGYDKEKAVLSVLVLDNMDGNLVIAKAAYQKNGKESSDAACFMNNYARTDANGGYDKASGKSGTDQALALHNEPAATGDMADPGFWLGLMLFSSAVCILVRRRMAR